MDIPWKSHGNSGDLRLRETGPWERAGQSCSRRIKSLDTAVCIWYTDIQWYDTIWFAYIYTHCLLFSSILLASLLFSCLCDRILLYSLVFASILLHSLLFYSFPCNIVSYHARTTNIWVTSRYCNQYIYIFWAFTLAICGHQETVNIGSS